jgi:lysozyme
MITSTDGIDLIKRFEGLRLNAYQDSVGVWTIGYGHTKGVYPGQSITAAQAEAMLRQELLEYEGYVDQYVDAYLTQQQHDALVSFVYNLGPGNFAGSTLRAKVNANPNDYTIPAEFLKWNKAGGQVLSGLTIRRQAEADLYAFGSKKKAITIALVLIVAASLIYLVWTRL